jgi:hypothetical protein
LQVTAEDECGLVGQAEAVLVDPSCSNSGTLTDTRSAVPHARMQGLTGFQTRALSHASILKSPLSSDLTWKYTRVLTCENVRRPCACRACGVWFTGNLFLKRLLVADF